MIATLMVATLAVAGWPQPLPAAGRRCSSVRFTAKLNAGQSFVQKVGNLVFKFHATGDRELCNGWTFTLEDAAGHDFIYPVNMPLRFNPSQFLACSYGLTAKQGLEMKRNMRFILTERDYLRLDPLMKDALWPGDSPDPRHAAENYLKAIQKVRTGLVRLKTVRYELSSGGLIQSATFRVVMVTPLSFHFAPALKPHPTPCPANPAQ